MKRYILIWHPDFDDPMDGLETAKGYAANFEKGMQKTMQMFSPEAQETAKKYVIKVRDLTEN